MRSSTAQHPSRPRFGGLWIPLVTPFRDDAVDHAVLAGLVAELAAAGVDGFVACGSTGEAAALDATEQMAVLDTVLAAAAGLPVLMGVGGHHVGHVREALVTACSRPVAGVLLAAPHYVRPSQEGLLAWFRTLADASTVPVVVYDIPARTGAVMRTDTLLALAEHPSIAAVKDCGGDLAKTLALIADGRLDVLAGDDLQLFATVAQGGSGAIAASAHVHTASFVAVLRDLARGELAAARARWLMLAPLVQALFAEPNPAPVKTLLARQGRIAGTLRSPMQPASAALADRLEREAARIAAEPPAGGLATAA